MEPKTILLEMKHFYQTIFTNIPQTVHTEYFAKVTQPVTIPPDDVIKMENEITEQEILKVVKSLPNNKTPGEDGLPSEFYKVFWIDIKSLLLNAYRYSFENGQLSDTKTRSAMLNSKKSWPSATKELASIDIT